MACPPFVSSEMDSLFALEDADCAAAPDVLPAVASDPCCVEAEPQPASKVAMEVDRARKPLRVVETVLMVDSFL
jgi:hypothetical protein